MDVTYEYMDEASIDTDLICSICQSPFKDPCCTPCCRALFCRECITQWIVTNSAYCPLCRTSLSTNVLTEPIRMVQNMLDRLPVKCILCGQTELQRGNFDYHVRKLCPKIAVTCPAADIKCSWAGQRDQLNQHLLDCRFESMRPFITQLITENQQIEEEMNQHIQQIFKQQTEIKQLEEQVNQQTLKIIGQQYEIEQFEEQMDQQRTQIDEYQNENQRLEENVEWLRTQVTAYQRENQQLNEQLRQNDAQVTFENSQSENQQLLPTAPFQNSGSCCDNDCSICNDRIHSRCILRCLPLLLALGALVGAGVLLGGAHGDFGRIIGGGFLILVAITICIVLCILRCERS